MATPINDNASIPSCTSLPDEAWIPHLDTTMNGGNEDFYTMLVSQQLVPGIDIESIEFSSVSGSAAGEGSMIMERAKELVHGENQMSKRMVKRPSYRQQEMTNFNCPITTVASSESLTSNDSNNNASTIESVDTANEHDDGEIMMETDEESIHSADELSLSSTTIELNKRMERSISRLAMSMKRSEISRQKVLEHGGGDSIVSLLMNIAGLSPHFPILSPVCPGTMD